MPDKGKAMSQIFFERQSKLIMLYQESYNRKEMTVKETVTALRMIGFGKTMATRRVSEWSAQISNPVPETESDKKRRAKERASLEKNMLRMRLGKKKYEEHLLCEKLGEKKYEEYTELRSKYKRKLLTRDKTVNALIKQFEYDRKSSDGIIDKWDAE